MLPPWSALKVATVIAAGVVIVITATIAWSLSGRLSSDFEQAVPSRLVGNESIGIRTEFDKQSYLIGDLIRYQIRVQWRDDMVSPNLQSFEKSINFFPLDYRDHHVEERQVAQDLREYTAEYVLQAVQVDVPAKIQLDTVTVSYIEPDDPELIVKSSRTNPSPVYFGEYYPADVSDVGLLPLKPAFDTAITERRGVLIACAAILLLAAIWLLLFYGSKRTDAELTASERLWRQLDRAADSPNDRLAVLGYEKFLTQALTLRTGITPTELWTSDNDGSGEQHEDLVSMRKLLIENYQSGAMPEKNINRIAALTREMLRPLVDEARLERESLNTPRERLRQQPNVVRVAGALLFVALCSVILAAFPRAWTPQELVRYNDATLMLESSGDLEQGIDDFAGLAQAAEDPIIKSASLYNLGTLLADPRRSRLSREQHRIFLKSIFGPTLTVSRILHDMELETEPELLTLLSELTRQYVQSEQNMRAAARTSPAGHTDGRSLELLGKIRRAIARSIRGLIRDSEQQSGRDQLLGQTVIDLQVLMETELPEEFSKTDEGKDDRSYFIMERF